MQYFLRLKLIFFAVALVTGIYLVTAYNSIFNSLRGELTIGRTVEANKLTTPTSNGFRPDGGFEFNVKPTQPFKDIVWLSVITGSGVGYGNSCAPTPCDPPPVEKTVTWIPQTPRGLLMTKDYIYAWRAENLSADRISFSTKMHKGKSYQFTGRFLIGGNFEESKPEGVVLTGRLVKLVDGQAVAEEEVTFSWLSWSEVDQQTFQRLRPIFCN